MGVALTETSWITSDDAMVLSEIITKERNIAVWQRPNNSVITHYFTHTFSALGLGLRGVYEMASLHSELHSLLPEHTGKTEVIEDIFLLCDMLTCLFDCDNVGLRLAPLSSAMCPKFHTDHIPVRLVNTYLGEGTQWLANEDICSEPENQNPMQVHRLGERQYFRQQQIRTLNAFDVALLKGSAWEQETPNPVLHRSCPMQNNNKRVLLTLDPM